MNIKQIEHGNKGAFLIGEGNERLGEMTYSRAGDSLLIIDHTAVSDQLRGQGVGKKLVLAAVEYARQNNLKIFPLCTFAKATFDRNPEIHDVLNA